jgi:uncharacterized membrane protein YhaH (DUF805 family)
VSDDETLTARDWARYGGLFALATLVLLVILGQREGAAVTLLAVYLLLACVALLVVQVRRSRS